MSGNRPVTVSVYGFVPMTRRRYVFQLVVAGGLALSLLVAWWLRWPLLRAELTSVPLASLPWYVRLGDAFPWLIAAGVALQAVEAWYVFGLFRRREAEGLNPAAPSRPPETPTNPSDQVQRPTG